MELFFSGALHGGEGGSFQVSQEMSSPSWAPLAETALLPLQDSIHTLPGTYPIPVPCYLLTISLL